MVGAWRILTAATLLVEVAAFGCGRTDAARAQRPNVLLVVVDTLRADRLGCYGSALGATPRIDALAVESVRFAQAHTHSPWTLPAFASLLTSLPPPAHGAGGQAGQFIPLSAEARTVAECFRDAGYATASVVNVDFLTEPFGLTQGFAEVDFEVYANNEQVRPAARTTDAAIRWLRKNRRPFFLLVHYFDPHLVYAPPAEYRRRFAAPEDQDNESWVFGTREQVSAYRQGRVTFDEATIRRAEKLYNGEVAYTDAEVGRLLDALRDLQLAGQTVVVLTADHGEEFFDHGSFEHGHTLYEELLRVPLLLRYPGRLDPGVCDVPVGLVDVAPTLGALAGVPVPPTFLGHDLVGLLGESPPVPRPIVLEGNFWGPPYRGWLRAGHKLIVAPDGARLFDLRHDPRELTDLAATNLNRYQEMQADLDVALRALLALAPRPAASPALNEAELQRLRSLGYLP